MRNKRRFPRTAAGTLVRYRSLPADRSTIDYLEGVVENVGLGGVFVATDDPLPKDSLVELEFSVEVDGQTKTIRAKALVKWARRLFRPAGMGLEFVEFSGLGQDDLKSWLERMMESA